MSGRLGFPPFTHPERPAKSEADANWPALVAKNGVLGGKSIVFTGKKGTAFGGYDPVA